MGVSVRVLLDWWEENHTSPSAVNGSVSIPFVASSWVLPAWADGLAGGEIEAALKRLASGVIGEFSFSVMVSFVVGEGVGSLSF